MASKFLFAKSFATTALLAVVLALAIGFVKPGFTNDSQDKKVTIENIPTYKLELTRSSVMFQKSWNYLLSKINSISSSKLRAQVLSMYQNTAPTFMALYQTDKSKRTVYEKLLNEGLIDANTVSKENLFPELKKLTIIPQPFFTAPGGSLNEHHYYPGGLVVSTAINVKATIAALYAYKDLYDYVDLYDEAVAGQLLQACAKPFVYQWYDDFEVTEDYLIAEAKASQVIGLSESIFRNLPVNVIIAQACAGIPLLSAHDEKTIVKAIKAAAIIAGRDPIALGLLSFDGESLPTPHHQSWYVVGQSSHNEALATYAQKQAIEALKEVFIKTYGMKTSDLKDKKFQAFKNYIGSQYSFMRIHSVMTKSKEPQKAVSTLCLSLIDVGK